MGALMAKDINLARNTLDERLSFLREAERLKDVLRSGRTASGRCESTADHTWRLCLFVVVFSDMLPDVDVLRLLKLCIIHDLGEVYVGDVAAIHQNAGDGRAARERADFARLSALLPSTLGDELRALYDEYDQASTAEARLAKGFDKLETMLQHTQGKNVDYFDYQFNLTYGKHWTDGHRLVAAIRAIIDDETRALSNGKKAWQR